LIRLDSFPDEQCSSDSESVQITGHRGAVPRRGAWRLDGEWEMKEQDWSWRQVVQMGSGLFVDDSLYAGMYQWD